MNILRKNTYWFIDSLKGSLVKKHLIDLERLIPDRQLLKEANMSRLAELVLHACGTTKFYNDFRGVSELCDLPVVTKSMIKQHQEDFLSTGFARRTLIPSVTSGSYGSPMTFYLSKDKRARQTAELIYFSRWSGYEVGIKHAYFRIAPSHQGKSLFKQFAQNEIFVDCSVLSMEWLESQRQMLKQRKIPLLIGYASVLTTLAQYILHCGDSADMFCVKGITPISEPFTEAMHAIVSTAFGCPVLARYSSQETGIIANQTTDSFAYRINDASYIVEILDLESDQPAESGQPGRIVITDLFSHAMPLIRYEIGDLAILDYDPAGFPVLTNLEGRLVSILYTTSGIPVHNASLEYVIASMKNILAFQFIQEDAKRYVVKFVPLKQYDETQQSICSIGLRKILGEDAEISFTRVDEIRPFLSGKRPYIINNYKNPPIFSVHHNLTKE